VVRKWIGLLLLIAVSAAALSGCWNRRELNELAITVGLAIDRAEDGGVRVSAQVVEPGEVASGRAAGGGGGNRSPVTLYSAKGESVFEAVRKLTTVSPRKIYFSHLRVVVFGESLLREGIAKELEFLSRDHEVRTDFYIIAAKGVEGHEVLDQLTPLVKLPAQKLFTSLQTSEQAWAPTYGVQLDELITSIVSKGKHPVLTAIEIKGDKKAGETQKNVEEIDSPANLTYSNLVAMKGDKIVGWLTMEESKGWAYITNNVQNSVGVIDCPGGGTLSLEIVRSKSSMRAESGGGRPSLSVDVFAEANIGEVRCRVDVSNPKEIRKLEDSAERKIVELMSAAVERSQQLRTDIFGFGEELHRTSPGAWRKLEKRWDETFADLPVRFQADVKIRRIGTTNKSFLQEVEE